MVQIYRGEILNKLRNSGLGKRMPLLYAMNRSFGWRIISENYEEHERGIRSEHCSVKDDYLTSMAICDETNIVIVGSGMNDGHLYFVKDFSGITDIESGPRFEIIHIEKLGTPIYSLDLHCKNLLVGTIQGITKIYKIDYGVDFELVLIGEYINPPSEIPVYAPSIVSNSFVKSVEFSPNYPSNSTQHFLTTTKNQISLWDQLRPDDPVRKFHPDELSLNSASWSPNHPNSLLVAGGNDKSLTIMDTRVPERDHNGIVWVASKAHDRPIRDAKFNPFIPYWLASAGEDSIVNIWDIRSSYHAPVGKIDGMMGMATSVTWSNIRPENLSTAATDGVLRYWTLKCESLPIWDTLYRISEYDKEDTLPITQKYDTDNVWFIKEEQHPFNSSSSRRGSNNSWLSEFDDDYLKSTMLLVGGIGFGEWGKPETGTIYKGEDVIESRGPVVSIKISKLRAGMYYSITSGGQLAAHTVRFDAISNLRNRHKYDPEDRNKLAAEIEDDIYCRRISEAQRKLETLKSTTQDDPEAKEKRDEEVAYLEDCLQLPKPIESSEWAFDSIPDKSNKRYSRRLLNDNDIWEISVNIFKNDLRHWTYRLPPGHNNVYKFPLEIKEPIAAHLVEEEEAPKEELPPFINDENESLKSNIITEEENASETDVIVIEPTKDHYSPSISERRNASPVPAISTETASRNNNPFITPPSSAHEESINKSVTTNPFLMMNSPEEEETAATGSIDASSEEHISDKSSGQHTHHSWLPELPNLNLTRSRKSLPEKAKKHSILPNPFKALTKHASIRGQEEQEEGPRLFSTSKKLLKRNSTARRNAIHGPFK